MALVWIIAFALVIAYYSSPAVAESAKGLQVLHAKIGLFFPAIAGFIAGGLLPELAKLLTGTLEKGENVLAEALFRGLVWVGLAVMVDIFYGWQAMWFGTGNDVITLIKKTLVDMVIFAPTIFVPYTVGMFVWRREKFNLKAFFSVFTPAGWKKEVLPTYIPNVCFWVIVLLAVYALPTDLQYPLSALATACWSIIFSFLQARHHVHNADIE